jgi:hypothetical protein
MVNTRHLMEFMYTLSRGMHQSRRVVKASTVR